MDLFGGVDGTGVSSDQQYKLDFTNSFVNQIFKTWDSPAKFYSRGPTWHGDQTLGLAKTLTANIVAVHKKNNASTGRIFLAGYSRGGAAVIKVCELLRAHKITVDCLLLFDAVDRTTTLAADVIPDNVRVCFHARRDPRSRSRTSFGHCGTRSSKATSYSEKFFFCTHGGMGGTPWTAAGADGFINEAATPVTDPRLRIVGAIAPALAGALAANDAHHASSRTAITLKQDRIGAGAVKQWMFAGLEAQRRALVA